MELDVDAVTTQWQKMKLEMELEEEEAVTTQWQKIEAYLQTHAPGGSQAHLNPGATEDEIVQAETALQGIRFPNDFRASLKRHNGQASFITLLGMGPLMSTEEIIAEWSGWKGLLDDGTFVDVGENSHSNASVKQCWWNPRWIPVTENGAGDSDCLDMDPAEGGAVGQVMEMCHDDGDRPVHAPSFLAWLTACASNLPGHLEDGTLVWDEENFTPKKGMVVRREWL